MIYKKIIYNDRTQENDNIKNIENVSRKVTSNTQELENLKQTLQDEIDKETEKRNKMKELTESQEFVTGKFDEYEKEHKEMKNDINEIKKTVQNQGNKIQTQESKLSKQENKTEHMFQYSRQDHVCFSGVPVCPDRNGIENCKLMVLNICRELHYSIPPNEISTAHRLKQHVNSTGPPGIIVRFKDRDIRKDVLRLNRQLKDKVYWHSYGIQRLYINEQLTPDK